MKEVAPPGLFKSAGTRKQALLIGMVYANASIRKANRRGQLERDGRRCAALEALDSGIDAYTLDTNRSETDEVVKAGRHFQGNVSDYRRLKKSITRCKSLANLSYVVLDYIHMPPCYIEGILSDKFFTTTLVGLATDNILKVDGQVW